jgi:Fe-S-cluster-containing dehydrogenase component
MARFGMVIDTRRCVGCMDCVVACQTENGVPLGQRRDWVVTEERGAFPKVAIEIRSERCNMCDNPPCVPVCPTGASHVSEFGKLVLVTERDCIKCNLCVGACPYGARFMNRDTGFADKCTFCVHRLKAGLEPACVSVCPTHAMHFGDLDDPNGKLQQLLAVNKHRVLQPEKNTRPRIHYLT